MTKLHKEIADKMKADGKRFWSNDNLVDYITDDQIPQLIEESTEAAEAFLQSLMIDTSTDPNANGTAKRIAKMYFNEVFRGRYTPAPDVATFPNSGDDAYEGMIVVRAELLSRCSHHHQNVTGVAYIAVIPTDHGLPGLSKYIRIAQHQAARGTLQEQLTVDIADAIQDVTMSKDVAVYIVAEHGCVSCRGVNQSNSNTQTSVLRGGFKEDSRVRQEFYANINLQTMMEK